MTDQTNLQTAFTPLPDESATAGQAFAATGVRQIVITQEQIAKYGIPQDWVAKDPALIELVLTTESMNDDERKYWFQLLPIMSDEQMTKLRGILQNERDQLAALDQKYASEMSKLESEHRLIAAAEAAKRQRAARQQAEAAHRAQEESNLDSILGEIDKM